MVTYADGEKNVPQIPWSSHVGTVFESAYSSSGVIDMIDPRAKVGNVFASVKTLTSRVPGGGMRKTSV